MLRINAPRRLLQDCVKARRAHYSLDGRVVDVKSTQAQPLNLVPKMRVRNDRVWSFRNIRGLHTTYSVSNAASL